MNTTTRPLRLRLAAVAALTSTLAATAPAAAASSAPADANRPLSQEELQREADRTLKEAGYVGLTVQVRDGGHRVSAGAGERELGTGRPVVPGAEFRAASVTKSFVATVVLQLVAEGRLSLTDTVDKWLPGVVAGNGNDGSRITVRNLLQHTSGIHDYDYYEGTQGTAADFERMRFDHHGPEETVARAMAHRPDFPPADPGDPEPDWNYSNTGYMLAGMIIKKVTGRSWQEEVHRRVVRPLGLKQTYAPGDNPRLRGPYTHTYQQFNGSTEWTDTSVRNVSWGDAAGELVSSAKDLDRFYSALYGGGLLPPAQQAEMRRTVPANAEFQEAFPGLGYGLAAMRQPLSCGGRRWGHGGDIEGTTIRTAVSGDGRRSVVLSATGMRADDAWARKSEKLLQDLLDRQLCARR